MKDKNVRNAAFNAFKGRGNDPNSNKKLIGALAQNKEVQSAAIEVAKDEKVQKAVWNEAKNNAKSANSKNAKNMKRNATDDDDDEFAEEMDEGPRNDYNPFGDD